MRKLITATMIAAMAASAAPVQAQSRGQDASVIRAGDGSLGCVQLASEAGTLARSLGGAPEQGVFSSEQAISAATSVAIQGAMMSGAGAILPGVGLLGNALGAAARRDRERREAERVVQAQRWYYLNGLYAGRDCDRQLALASVQLVPEAPEPAASAPPAE